MKRRASSTGKKSAAEGGAKQCRRGRGTTQGSEDASASATTTEAMTKTTTSNTLFDKAMRVVLESNNGMLHWYEAMKIGQSNKSSYKLWVRHKSKLLEPLYLELDAMAASNKHHYCDKIYMPLSKRECACTHDGDYSPLENPYCEVDPRYTEDFDSRPMEEKCKLMVRFLSFLANNIWSLFDFDRLTDPDAQSSALSFGGWSFGMGHELQNYFWAGFPQCSTLALNLAFLDFAQHSLRYAGDDCYFNDVFLGKENPLIGGGSMYGISMVDGVRSMFPFTEKRFCEVVHEGLYPSQKAQSILGPQLIKKLHIASPLFDMFPLGTPNTAAVTLPTVEASWVEDVQAQEEEEED